MFSQSLAELANNQKKNFHAEVVFSEKSGKMYMLNFTTFHAFWRDTLLGYLALLPFGGLACWISLLCCL
jgi:hypothetical protein